MHSITSIQTIKREPGVSTVFVGQEEKHSELLVYHIVPNFTQSGYQSAIQLGSKLRATLGDILPSCLIFPEIRAHITPDEASVFLKTDCPREIHDVCLLQSRYIQGVSLKEWMCTHNNLQELFQVISQVMILLHLFSEWKLIHNDLHFQNILVHIHPYPKHIEYHGVDQSVYTRHEVYVIDFERAWMPGAPNPSLGKLHNYIAAQYERFTPGYDLYTVLYNVKRIHGDFFKELWKICIASAERDDDRDVMKRVIITSEIRDSLILQTDTHPILQRAHRKAWKIWTPFRNHLEKSSYATTQRLQRIKGHSSLSGETQELRDIYLKCNQLSKQIFQRAQIELQGISPDSDLALELSNCSVTHWMKQYNFPEYAGLRQHGIDGNSIHFTEPAVIDSRLSAFPKPIHIAQRIYTVGKICCKRKRGCSSDCNTSRITIISKRICGK